MKIDNIYIYIFLFIYLFIKREKSAGGQGEIIFVGGERK